MTARHIDATDKTDGSHVVKILWNENDGERELTVRMPAAGTDATDRCLWSNKRVRRHHQI